MVLQLFTMGFEVFAHLHARTGAQAPCLAWLAKHLECCNFGVSSLIELKFFGEWSLQLFTMVFEFFVQVHMQGHTCPAWPGWLNL